MRFSIIATALLLAGGPAMAQTPAPKTPDMVLVPTNVVGRLLQFMGDPHIASDIPLYASDVKPLLLAIQQCANDQIPNAQGIIADAGDCPLLTAKAAEAAKPAADATAAPSPPK